MRHHITTFALILTLAGLASCSSHDPFKPHAAGNVYNCASNRQIVLSIRDNADAIALSYAGRDLTLYKINTSTKGAAYSNSIYTLYYDEENDIAALEREGVPILTQCIR